MIFKMITKDKLKVVLSPIDMDRLAISYSALDYHDDLTRQVLLQLLSTAKEKTGFDPCDTRLFIEVYPYDEGGCVIYFTTLDTETDSPLAPAYGPVVFMFDDVDILIQASIKLFCQYCHRIYKSSLYLIGGEYRLIIYPLDQDDNRTIAFLCEYGQKVGEGPVAAAFVEEHGQVILKERAIDTLSYYLAGE